MLLRNSVAGLTWWLIHPLTFWHASYTCTCVSAWSYCVRKPRCSLITLINKVFSICTYYFTLDAGRFPVLPILFRVIAEEVKFRQRLRPRQRPCTIAAPRTRRALPRPVIHVHVLRDENRSTLYTDIEIVRERSMWTTWFGSQARLSYIFAAAEANARRNTIDWNPVPHC